MKLPDGEEKSINIINVPKDANLTDYMPLEEENEKLFEVIKNVRECLTSGNSCMISDPRPALEHLDEALTF